MNEKVTKRLRWLIFNFPIIKKPKDDADRLSNCISLYCQGALDEIIRQDEEIERLKKENEQFADIGKLYSEVRADAINEYIKELEKYRMMEDKDHITVVPFATIKAVANRMVGDSE